MIWIMDLAGHKYIRCTLSYLYDLMPLTIIVVDIKCHCCWSYYDVIIFNSNVKKRKSD